MSIYASIPGIDNEAPCGPPWVYQGSHILPAEVDPRGGSIGLALIPSHITRDGRDDQPEEGQPWPWLRISIDTPGHEPVALITPVQARHLAGYLTDWADGRAAGTDGQPDVRDEEVEQLRYERDTLRDALEVVTGQCRAAEGRVRLLTEQSQAAVKDRDG